jgi:hypothetical protein
MKKFFCGFQSSIPTSNGRKEKTFMDRVGVPVSTVKEGTEVDEIRILKTKTAWNMLAFLGK